jgi:DNA-binding transcriptional LysR family regulator
MRTNEIRVLDDRRLTLEQLRVFVSIVDLGGFQGASSQMHRTQSAVTQSLKKLEETLGCRLLDRRQGHVLGLTLEGGRFLPTAREILGRVSDALTIVQRPELSGRIKLGVPDDFQLTDLHEAISRCLHLNKRLRIEVTSSLSAELLKMITRGDLDMALLKDASTDTRSDLNGVRREVKGNRSTSVRFVSSLLRAEPLHWVSSRRIAFADLAEVPLVAFPEGCAYRMAALAALSMQAKPSFFSYTSASYDNIRNAVSAGLGVATLPSGAIAEDHFILTAKDGFPDLPPVRLTLHYRPQGILIDQFADVIESLLSNRPRPSDHVFKGTVRRDTSS